MDATAKQPIPFDELPKVVQDYLYSPELSASVESLGKKYKLHLDIVGMIERDINLVLAGSITLSEFADDIARDVGGKDKAVPIITDIQSTIFNVIRERERAEIEKKKTEQEVSTVHVEATTPPPFVSTPNPIKKPEHPAAPVSVRVAVQKVPTLQEKMDSITTSRASVVKVDEVVSTPTISEEKAAAPKQALDTVIKLPPHSEDHPDFVSSSLKETPFPASSSKNDKLNVSFEAAPPPPPPPPPKPVETPVPEVPTAPTIPTIPIIPSIRTMPKNAAEAAKAIDPYRELLNQK